jgi:parallel beta-helix repeat protein
MQILMHHLIMSGLSKSLSLLIISILALSTLTISEPAKADTYSTTIVIKSDGSISGTNDIQREGNTYSLKNNINATISIGKDNIILDGAGYSIQGNGNATGVVIHGSGITVKNLQIKGCSFGISLLSKSSNCIISGNHLVNNVVAFDFTYAPNNILTNNSLENNCNSIIIDGNWENSIDSSNTINGKPIYYFVNQKDLVINPSGYPKIGYFALVNCTRITVKNLDFSNRSIGIIMVSTTNSIITQNRIADNRKGILLSHSYGNSISENQIIHNDVGISVSSTSPNTIEGNNLVNNEEAISLGGANQVIYHNNFINNSKNADASYWWGLFYPGSQYLGMHVWDNGFPSGGNYWSGYGGVDPENDGIGNVPYVVNSYRNNNTDHYPLMKPVDVPPDYYVAPDETPHASPSSSPTPAPTTVTGNNAMLLGAVLIVAVIAIGAGILVYFKKRRGGRKS